MKTNSRNQSEERELRQFAQKLYQLLKAIEKMVGNNYSTRKALLESVETAYCYYWGNFTFTIEVNGWRKFFRSYRGWLDIYGVMKDNNISKEMLIPVLKDIHRAIKIASSDARWK